MTLRNTIINHSYLQFNNEYYKQEDGLAMGAPTSAVLAKISSSTLNIPTSPVYSKNTSSITPDMSMIYCLYTIKISPASRIP
jgi:hypothetical protein